MNIKCHLCDAYALDLTAWDNWLQLMHFVEFLNLQQIITDDTMTQMVNCLMSFKGYAMKSLEEVKANE